MFRKMSRSGTKVEVPIILPMLVSHAVNSKSTSVCHYEAEAPFVVVVVFVVVEGGPIGPGAYPPPEAPEFAVLGRPLS